MVILIAFAAAVGRLASDRLRSDFHDELRAAAGQLAFEIASRTREASLPDGVVHPDLEEVVMTDGASVRIVRDDGSVISATRPSPELGPPSLGVGRVGPWDVATTRVPNNTIGFPDVYVQYAQNRASVEETVDRVWLFLGGGVLAGALLAGIAGMAVAGRAMRPIAEITAAAREVGATRDPDRRVPAPETNDEVAELAHTFDRMLAELAAARAETEAAIKRQREFVADASHELRTPLTSVLANLEMLEEDLSSPERRGGADNVEVAGSALASARRMNRLVSDLLLLARADSGRRPQTMPCDLTDVVRAAVREALSTAGEHRIVVDVDQPVEVDGNPDELHRMAANLIDNAVRHTPPGTTIRVSARAAGETAVLEVADDGPGLPAELRETVFDRFVRADGPADTSSYGGTGLGLAIVRAVAGSHGGSVSASDAPEGGALFTVELPATREDEAA